MFMICSYGDMPDIEFLRSEIERRFTDSAARFSSFDVLA